MEARSKGVRKKYLALPASVVEFRQAKGGIEKGVDLANK